MEISTELQEYFKSKNVEIVLSGERKKQFATIEQFVEFFDKETEFWGFAGTSRLQPIKRHFYEIHNKLKDFRQANDIETAKRHLEGALCEVRDSSTSYIYSENPEAQFLKELVNIHVCQADAAYDYIIRNYIDSAGVQRGGLEGYHYLTGLMRAYQFKEGGKTCDIEIESEKKALTKLSSTFNDDLSKLSTKFTEKTEQVEKEFSAFQRIMQKEQTTFKTETATLLENSKNDIANLKTLYNEELKLKGPADYWQDSYRKYEKKGGYWCWAALITGVIFMLFLSAILYDLPKPLLEEFNINGVKATIVFALIASIGIYLIRLFVMLSTSAYHLSRDANERHQLTYVYLALLHEKGVGIEERNIVLQSIFSRADTGLLKGDSSPTLPDGVLSQIYKCIKNK